MLTCHLHIFFGEVSVKVLDLFLIGLFVFLLLNFKCSLYISDNSPLSDMSFVNIFSDSIACLFILLTVSFTEQKILILIKSSLSIISFMDHFVFGVGSKKSSPNPESPRFSPMLSFRSFIMLHFAFTSVIHFKLVFVKCVKVCD